MLRQSIQQSLKTRKRRITCENNGEALNTTGMDKEIMRTVKRAERLEIEVFGRLFNTRSHLLHSTIALPTQYFIKRGTITAQPLKSL